MTQRTYLDWNATAPLRPEAKEALAVALELTGNPSSVHAEGRAARALVETARALVAELVGGEPANVIFTSGGTEANVVALSPEIQIGRQSARDRLLISAVEHPSVTAGGRFRPDQVEILPVDAHGVVDLGALEVRLAALAAEGARPLVSVMLANNETGVIQPVAEVASVVHRHGALLHVDAVQAAGRIAVDINALEADLLTLSAHKIGGPQGIGALIKRDEALRIVPLIRGGGQERGLRGGTENVAGIAGFGAAAAAAGRDLAVTVGRMLALRDALEHGLRQVEPATVIFGSAAERLPNTTLFTVAGLRAETAIIAFDLAGVALSSGAACSSGKVQPSHVLAAMGVDPALAKGAVRVSIGWDSNEADIECCLAAWRTVSGALLKRSREIAA
jgi:cysteine desulfurase